MAMPPPEWKTELAELNPDALFANGFDDAYVGWIENRWVKDGAPIAVYSMSKCIRILMAQGMNEDEASDYYCFNIVDAYHGPNTPLFLADRYDYPESEGQLEEG